MTIQTTIEAEVHDKDALFFRHDCGKANHPDMGEFELSFGVGTGSPIVRLPDGRWVTFSWSQLIEAACKAGGLLK